MISMNYAIAVALISTVTVTWMTHLITVILKPVGMTEERDTTENITGLLTCKWISSLRVFARPQAAYLPGIPNIYLQDNRFRKNLGNPEIDLPVATRYQPHNADDSLIVLNSGPFVQNRNQYCAPNIRYDVANRENKVTPANEDMPIIRSYVVNRKKSPPQKVTCT